MDDATFALFSSMTTSSVFCKSDECFHLEQICLNRSINEMYGESLALKDINLVQFRCRGSKVHRDTCKLNSHLFLFEFHCGRVLDIK